MTRAGSDGTEGARSGLSADEVTGLFSRMRTKSKSQRHELQHKHAEELMTVYQKYKQVKEQLRVQQELMNNRESAEKLLQDQLNKTTTELAHLRVIKDDLSSSLKQSTAQVQYLTREMEHIQVESERSEKERCTDVGSLREEGMVLRQENEKLKTEYETAAAKWEFDRNEMKRQIAAARRAINDADNENCKISTESRTIQAQFESEKSEYIRKQRKFTELQMKCAKLSENLAKAREENERLKESEANIREQLQRTESALQKSVRNEKIVASQNKMLAEDLKEKTELLNTTGVGQHKARMQLSSASDELRQTQKILERTRQSFAVELDAIRQQLANEKAAYEGLMTDHEHLVDEFNEQAREMKHEKAIRGKIEVNEGVLKQRIVQTESIIADRERERISLVQQVVEMNEEMQMKNVLIGEKDDEIRELGKHNVVQTEQLKDARLKIEHLSSEIARRSNGELSERYANLVAQHGALSEQFRLQQGQLRETLSLYNRACSEKHVDIQTIDELSTTLAKERDVMKAAIQERHEISGLNKSLREEITSLRAQVTQMDSDISLAQAENTHMSSVIRKRQKQLTRLSQSQMEASVKMSQVLKDYCETKAGNTVLVAEQDALKTENERLTREVEEGKLREVNFREKLKTAEKSLVEAKQKIADSEKAANTLGRAVSDLQTSYDQASYQLRQERSEKEEAIVKCQEIVVDSKSSNSSLKAVGLELGFCRAELADKSATLAETQLSLEQFKDVVAHLNSENEALTREKARLLEKGRYTEKRLRTVTEDNELLRAKVSTEIQDTLDQLSAERNAMCERSETSERRLDEAQDHVDELREVISGLQEQLKMAHQKSKNAELRVFDLGRQVSERDASVKIMQLQNQDQSDMLGQLREERKILKDQVEVLEQKLIADHIQLESMKNADIETLRVRFKVEQTLAATVDENQKQLIRTLEIEKHSLAKENRKMKRQSAVFISTHAELQDRLDTISKQRETLMKENQDLKMDSVSRTQSYANLEKQNKRLAKEKTRLVDEIRVISDENERLEAGHVDVFRSRTKLAQSESEMKRMEIRLATIANLNESLKKEMTEAKTARDRVSQDFDTITDAVGQIRCLLSPSDDMLSSGLDVNEIEGLRARLVESQRDIALLIKERDALLLEKVSLPRRDDCLSFDSPPSEASADDLTVESPPEDATDMEESFETLEMQQLEEDSEDRDATEELDVVAEEI